MIHPDNLGELIVSAWQSMPQVVNLLGGDPTNINYWKYSYASSTSLARAVFQLQDGQVLLAWAGTSPGSGEGMQVWKHRYRVIFKPGPEIAPGCGPSGATIWRALVHGNVVQENTGNTLKFLYWQPAPNIEPMDLPSVVQKTNPEEQDYFEGQLVYPELGDYDD